MRIYEGSPRQDFEEVLRSIGAFLDQRGMREIMLIEVPDGFIVQGLVAATSANSGWSDQLGTVAKETLTFLDDDIARFMEEAVARRATGAGMPDPPAGTHEAAFRVLGHYLDEQKPRDVFFFEQEGAFVVRILLGGQQGSHHTLAEFTRDDIEALVSQGPAARAKRGEATPAAGS
jgi:hypothetical protein